MAPGPAKGRVVLVSRRYWGGELAAHDGEHG